MKLITGLNEIERQPSCAVALGTFDGMHLGHLRVIEAALQDPKLEPAVFTFQKNPHRTESIMTFGDKCDLLEEMGVKRLYHIDFSDVKEMAPVDFLHDILLQKCNAGKLCCGADFRFGKGAAGDVDLLKKFSMSCGVTLQVVPQAVFQNEKISSTRIRESIKAGDMVTVQKMLGRPFGFTLEVIHGNHIGTGLGMPTINQALPENFILPRFGVYASYVRVDDKFHYGVTNIGVKPTVGSDKVLSETWMPDFSGDLYGCNIQLFILEFIRPERKFGSIEEMKAEVFKNAGTAKEITAKYQPSFLPKPLYKEARL